MKNNRITRRLISLTIAALMLLPFTAARATEDSLYYTYPIIMPSESGSTGSWWDAAGTFTCQYCGQEVSYSHICSFTTTCESCGATVAANLSHKCTFNICIVCGQSYGAAKGHDCPGGKVCSECGTTFNAFEAHTCPEIKTCPNCGVTYAPSDGHKCDGPYLYGCDICGQPRWSNGDHDCPGGVTCILCGTLYSASEGHICGGSFKILCSYCREELEDGESHTRCNGCGQCFEGDISKHEKECPARVPCETCGEYMVPNAFGHFCDIIACFKCGETYKLSEKHTCTQAKCIYCEKVYLKSDGHVCEYTKCHTCGETYKRTASHSCEKCAKCGEKLSGDSIIHICPYITCITCREEYNVNGSHTCKRAVCLHCGNVTAPDEGCHASCMFCGVVEGSWEAHEASCQYMAQMKSCEYCGNSYIGEHSDCTHAPQSAVNGQVTVEVDFRAGKGHIREFTMTGKVGDSYSLNCPEELLEYHYNADGKHYTYYKLDSIEDHNGGKFIDGMRKIDVWYVFMGRLTETEAQTITESLPTAGDDLLSPDGQPILPDIQPAEQEPDTPVVIPPEETEEGEKASVVVMHLDAVTGESMWFMSILSCPVGGTIDLPSADMPGYLFSGYYNSDTGERYGGTYTAQTADTVFLVAEYTYVGDALEDAEPTPAPEPSTTPEPTPTPAPGPKVNNPENLNRDMADEIARLINQERTSRGLPELQVKVDLTAIAEARSEEIVTDFSHNSASGILTGLGENIAAWRTSARAFVDGWMNSTGHRENILNEDYDFMGIGVYDDNGRLYAANVFEIDLERVRRESWEELLAGLEDDGWVVAPPLDAPPQEP